MKYIRLVLLLILALLFGILILFNSFYGDYSSGIYQMILSAFVVVLILINLGVLYFIAFKQKKYKVTNYVLLVLMMVLLINSLVGYINLNKSVFKTFVANEELSYYRLVLYEDMSCHLKKRYPHGYSVWAGNYQISKNQLLLDFGDEHIETLSKANIASEYKFDSINQIYQAVNDKNKVLVEQKP